MFGISVDIWLGGYDAGATGPLSPAQAQPLPNNAARWGTDDMYWGSLPIAINAPPVGSMLFNGHQLMWGSSTLHWGA